jgi:hypothetical protein
VYALIPSFADGGRFHPGFMLHDPYATRIVPVLLPETAYTNAPKLPPTYDVKQPVMLSSLAGFTQVGSQVMDVTLAQAAPQMVVLWM